MSQKGNTLVIGILIGLLIAGSLFGAYFVGTRKQTTQPIYPVQSTQSIQPTSMPIPSNIPADWKTQIFNSEGFTISFPPNWEVEESGNLKSADPANVFPKYTTILWPPGNKASTQDFGHNIYIETYIVPPKTTLDDFVLKKFWGGDKNSFENVTYNKVPLNGMDGYFVDGIPACCADQETVVIPSGIKFYVISTVENSGKNPISPSLLAPNTFYNQDYKLKPAFFLGTQAI